jgi:hypothetical protein
MAVSQSGSLCHAFGRESELSCYLLIAWLTLRPEDGGDMFRRNVGPSPKYTALQSRRPYF